MLNQFVIAAVGAIVMVAFQAQANPLFDAIETQDHNRLAHLLTTGENPNVKDDTGLTPLHRAAGYGDLPAVELLLANKADLHLLDSVMGSSALHKAATPCYTIRSGMVTRRPPWWC